MLSLEQYALFLLSMKKKGKAVDLAHIEEKAKRDMPAFDSKAVGRALDALIDRQHVSKDRGNFLATEAGRSHFKAEFPGIEAELRKVNEAWSLVYVAKNYYPEVAETITTICRDRYVGFFCVFTEEHFFRRKLGRNYITLKRPSDLLRLVDMHYVDVIPCVHRIGSNRPDWLVIDLDAGSSVPFGEVKKAALLTHEALIEHDLCPALKFSGSRGFQVWAQLEDFRMPDRYQPMALPGGSDRTLSFFSLYADMIAYVEAQIRDEMGGRTTSTVADKEGREDKILLDSSPMKEMGLVRSPYSLHHRTGLVSMPLVPDEIKSFDPSMARPEDALARFRRQGNEFHLPARDPGKMVKSTLGWIQDNSRRVPG